MGLYYFYLSWFGSFDFYNENNNSIYNFDDFPKIIESFINYSNNDVK